MGCLLARERSPLPPPPSSIVRVEPRGSRRDLLALVPSPREVAGCSCSSCATVDGRDGKALWVSVRDGEGLADPTTERRRGQLQNLPREVPPSTAKETRRAGPGVSNMRTMSTWTPSNDTLVAPTDERDSGAGADISCVTVLTQPEAIGTLPCWQWGEFALRASPQPLATRTVFRYRGRDESESGQHARS